MILTTEMNVIGAADFARFKFEMNFWETSYITTTPEVSGPCQSFNISRTLVGNKIIDHSNVVGASPVSAAPATSSFST